MCAEDFSIVTPVSARLKKALAAHKAANLSRPLSVAIVALSEGETGGVWLRPRPLDPECCSLTVGLESYGPNHERLNSVLMQDEPLTSWLANQGLIGPNENGGYKPINGLGNPLDPSKNALFFEYVMATQRQNALKLFSIGPTQMYLSFVFPNQGIQPRCGWPHEWDELWDFYTAGGADVPAEAKVAYTTATWLGYLRRTDDHPEGGCLKNVPYPDGSPSAAIAWLKNQAGNTPDATLLYENPSIKWGSRRPYKSVWAEVNAYALDMGWQM